MKKESKILKITMQVSFKGKNLIEKEYDIKRKTDKRYYCALPDSKSKTLRFFGKNEIMVPDSIYRYTIHSDMGMLSYTVITLKENRDEAVQILNESIIKRFNELKTGFKSLERVIANEFTIIN